jgi:transposase
MGFNRSMRGTAEQQSSFTSIDVICEDLLDDEGFLATLRAARGTVFSDADFGVIYPSGRGRPSHPPSVLAALLLAQLFFGVSDREAERRSRLDLSWKNALGLPLEHRGIPHVCLVEFRARVVRADMAGFFNQKLLQLAKRAGVIGHRRIVDSTGIADCVVTMDTITLIRSATRHCLEQLAKLDKRVAKSCRSSLARDDYELRSKPEINWSSTTERAELLAELYADATAVLAATEGRDDSELAEATALLRVVCAQDLETSDGDGEVAITRGVAPGRVISTVDVDARHGHRSRSDRYDGFKVHLAVDPDSDLVTAATASRATTHDGEVLPALIAADPLAICEVIADTHYGAASTRTALVAAGIELVAPAQPVSAKKGLFSKADFAIDLDARTVTCPAGVTVAIADTKAQRTQVRFADSCSSCALRIRCTTRAGGRIVELHPDEELLVAARAARWTPQFRDRYRERARVERKNAQLKSRTTKVPWRGLVKVDAWVKLRVAAMNLDRMGRTPGLIG